MAPGATLRQASVTQCNLSFIRLSEEVNPGVYHQYSGIMEYLLQHLLLDFEPLMILSKLKHDLFVSIHKTLAPIGF